MVRYIPLLLFIGLAWGQTFDPNPITVEEDSNEAIAEEKSILNKHNISVGMFDDRTGLSLIGYTYNIKQTTMDEYFIGAGTMLVGFTGTVGWKHYYSKSKSAIKISKLLKKEVNQSFSSILCAQYVAHIGFMGFLPTVSITLEYDITNLAQLKLGVWGFTLLGGTSGESGGHSGVLPFIGLSFDF